MSALFGRIVNRVMAMPVVRIAKTQVEFYAKAMSELIFLRHNFQHLHLSLHVWCVN